MNSNENQMNNNINQDVINPVPNPTPIPEPINPVEVPGSEVAPVIEPAAPMPESTVVMPTPEPILEVAPTPVAEPVVETPVTITPAPVENPQPIPTPVPSIEPVAPIPEPPVAPEPIPEIAPTPVAEPVVETPVTITPAAVENPQPMNLQPEGVVIAPVAESTSNVAEPLVSATLSSDTVIATPTAEPMPQPVAPEINNISTPLEPTNPGVVPPELNNPMMGGVPVPPQIPAEPEKKKKEGKKISPFIIVLIIILIGAVGYGVYYFLNASESKATGVKISPKLTSFEIGNYIEYNSALYFAEVEGMNIFDCTVTTDMDAYKTGTYTYTVTCGDTKTGTQTVIVKDSTAPKVITKKVVVTPNTNVTIENFIDGVNDFSTYTIESDVQDINTSTVGEYDVKFKVIDAYQNETEVTGKLVVDEYAPVSFTKCEKESTSKDFRDAQLTISYEYGFNALGEYVSSVKNVLYTFEDQEVFDYVRTESLREGYENLFDGYTGSIIHEKENGTIRIKNDLDAQSLSTEFGVASFPTSAEEIVDLHTINGYICY